MSESETKAPVEIHRRAPHRKKRLLLGLGLLFLGVSVLMWLRGADQTWQPAAAKVILSEPREHGSEAKAFSIETRYSYSVGAKTYFGKAIRHFTAQTQAVEYQSQQVPGMPLDIFYDPSHPDVSVLILPPKTTTRSWLPGLLFAAGALGVAAAIVLSRSSGPAARHQRRRAP